MRLLSFLNRFLFGGRSPHLLPNPPTIEQAEDAFLATFTQGSGQLVLQHLHWYVVMTEIENAAEAQGRQHVYRYIIDMMQKAHFRHEREGYGRSSNGANRDYLSPSDFGGAIR